MYSSTACLCSCLLGYEPFPWKLILLLKTLMVCVCVRACMQGGMCVCVLVDIDLQLYTLCNSTYWYINSYSETPYSKTHTLTTTSTHPHTHTHIHTPSHPHPHPHTLTAITVGFEFPTHNFPEPASSFQQRPVCMVLTGRPSFDLTVGVNWVPGTATRKCHSI